MSAIACYIPHFQDLFKPGLLNFLWDISFSIKVTPNVLCNRKGNKDVRNFTQNFRSFLDFLKLLV